MKKTIIVLTGTPGCGKTSLCDSIVKKIEARVIHLTNIVIDDDYPKEFDKQRDTWIFNEKIMKKTIKKQIRKIQNDKVKYIIIESHFSDIVPNEFIDMAFVLRCEPEILYRRLIKRGYSEKKAIENVQSEILGNCANYLLKKKITIPIYEIDTSMMQIHELRDLVIKIINSPNLMDDYLIGKIDWLQKISDNEQLARKFFYNI